MKEINALKGVMDFHEKFNSYIGSTPAIPDAQTCELRENLLQEELNEFTTAIENDDLVEATDALIDLQYVLSGAIIAFGLHNIAYDLFEEVQRSNMSKLCKTMDEALATVEHYKIKKGFNCYIKESGDLFVVKRVEDGKILKSVAYSPCDLKSIIIK
jgi:predicted HAD superfamily Cof-like phosphohydrolase